MVPLDRALVSFLGIYRLPIVTRPLNKAILAAIRNELRHIGLRGATSTPSGKCRSRRGSELLLQDSRRTTLFASSNSFVVRATFSHNTYMHYRQTTDKQTYTT